MDSRLRTIAVLVAGALAAGTIVGCGNTTPETEEKTGAEPIKIGAVLSLTGGYAGLGTSSKNAIELEVERINAAGGVNGRQIEVLIEDDATEEAKAVAGASKLLQQEGVVAVLGASGTGQTMAMRSEIQRSGVAQLSMAGGSAITATFDPLVFQTPWPNKIVVPFVLDAMSKAGYKKVGLISDSGGYGKDGHGVIVEKAPDYGLTIVSDQVFNPNDTDMSAQLTRIRESGADCILMWTAMKDASTIVKNRAALKLELPVYAGSGIARREFIEGAGAAGEGVLFGTGKALLPEGYGAGSPNETVIKDFATRYEAKYGQAPDIFAGHAYDALNIVVEAAKRLPADFTAAQLRDEIEKTSGFVGYDGTFTFSAADHNGLTEKDLQMYRISGGKWEIVSQ